MGGYRYGGNSFEIFERVFGTTNPFAEKPEDDGRDQFGSLLGDGFKGAAEPLLPAPADIHVTLAVSLHELYNGCHKKVEYERKVLLLDGRSTRSVKEELAVEVRPGYSEATVLTFSSKGNEAEGHKPSKLIVHFS